MRIALVATGGTISTVTSVDGGRSATLRGEDLLAAVRVPTGVEVDVRDFHPRGSYSFSLADMSAIVCAIVDALRDGADGVVVTHGTDTLEQTALLADIRLNDARPIVFTGAQRSADHPDSDGPDNLSDAIAVAAAPHARERGVLIAFGGRVLRARGTSKVETISLDAFRPSVGGGVGFVQDGDVALVDGPAVRCTPHLPDRPDEVRVDIICTYGGMGRELIDASVQAGARGIVFEGTGSGNATPEVLAEIKELQHAGISAVISSRVVSGPLNAQYSGSGGGKDLVRAGAILTTDLRPPQARILLACLIAHKATADEATSAFASHHAPHQQ